MRRVQARARGPARKRFVPQHVAATRVDETSPPIQVGSFAPYPPVRRLLEPLIGMVDRFGVNAESVIRSIWQAPRKRGAFDPVEGAGPARVIVQCRTE